MGYKDSFHPQAYRILIMREQQGMTYQGIGERLRFHGSYARQLYIQAKLTQKNQYVQEIGKHQIDIAPTLKLLDHEYFDNVLIVAYLEAEFPDILIPFRDGEPGSSYILSAKLIRRAIKLRSNYRLRPKLHTVDEELERNPMPDSSAVIEAVDVHGKSFESLGDQYKIHYYKLIHVYNRAKILEIVQLASQVSERYDVPFDVVYRRSLNSLASFNSRIAELYHWLEEGY